MKFLLSFFFLSFFGSENPKNHFDFSIFAGVRVVGVCVLVYARTHTQTTWVLDVSPGVGRTPGGPEESRSTFLFRKVEDVTTISKSQSLTSVSINDCTLRVPNKTTTLFLYEQ